MTVVLAFLRAIPGRVWAILGAVAAAVGWLLRERARARADGRRAAQDDQRRTNDAAVDAARQERDRAAGRGDDELRDRVRRYGRPE